MTQTLSRERHTEGSTHNQRLVFAAIGATLVTALLAAVSGSAAALGFLGVAVAVVLFTVSAVKPVFATYAYIVTLPILAGVSRDALIPLVRPNEALLVVLLGGACFGAYLRLVRGDDIRPTFYPMVDLPLAVFLVFSSIWPLASLTLRGEVPTPTEWASVLPMLKLAGVYFLVRYTISTEQQILRLIRFIVWPGAVVALIAILQTLNFTPVLLLLDTFWAGAEDGASSDLSGLSDRGSTTLGSPIATGDYVIISLIIVLCCGARGLLGRRERLVLALLLGTGVFAAGQFSTWIAALVAGSLLAWRFPDLRRQAKRFLPVFGIALLIGAPALIGRLESFGDGGSFLPVSWQGRADNLWNLFIPHFNWVTTFTGVSPDPVLAAPETWREIVYLESGVLYFVWIGGIPLLLAFIWLSVRVLRMVRPAIGHPGPFGAASSSLEIVWLFLLVLTVIDPHLQLRGTGELIFTLLAITVGGIDAQRRT